jgi:double-strand break repair protein MRE11
MASSSHNASELEFCPWQSRRPNVVPRDTVSSSETFRILIATDNHLGFMEGHESRGNDSFAAFEEILKTAVEQQVDMLLLGGDLFHANQPSRSTILKTLALFRKYCMGDRPIMVQCVSNPESHFHSPFQNINYEDPHLNIALPVFIIHGNHDDPVEGTSAIDYLSHCGLVNYFGKQSSQDQFQVTPVLLRKGSSRLALYGLGYYSDIRAARLFQDNKVTFVRPAETPESYFNIFLIHQNREQKGGRTGETNVNENSLPAFLDAVFWGHEHECKVHFTPNAHGTLVSQLGSSVATSLMDYEAGPAKKHIMLLEVSGVQYRYAPVPLRCTRRLYYENITIADAFAGKEVQRVSENDIVQFVKNRIRSLLSEDNKERALRPRPDGFERPLIRVRVNYSGGYPLPRTQLIQSDFLDEVANATEIVLLARSKNTAVRGPKRVVQNGKEEETEQDAEGGANANSTLSKAVEDLAPAKIEEMVIQNLMQNQKVLHVFSEQKITAAVHSFVEFEVASAIPQFVDDELTRAQKQLLDSRLRLLDDLKEKRPDSGRPGAQSRYVVELLQKSEADQVFRDVDMQVLGDLRKDQENAVDDYVRSLIDAAPSQGGTAGQGDSDSNSDEEMSSSKAAAAPTASRNVARRGGSTARGRGKAAAAAADTVAPPTATATRGRGSKRSSQSTLTFAAPSVEVSDEEEERMPAPTTKRGRKK